MDCVQQCKGPAPSHPPPFAPNPLFSHELWAFERVAIVSFE